MSALLLPSLTLAALSSLLVTGTLTPTKADLDLLLLWITPLSPIFCVDKGWFLLWLDYHLFIDTSQTGMATPVNYSYVATSGLLALRVEWLNNAPSPCSISLSWLSWRGNTTASSIIPSTAFSPFVSPADAAAAALRARVTAPPWAWSTYGAGTFWTHVHMPSALAIQVTLVKPSTGAQLGFVQVYELSDPAIVRVLGHGYDGSPYTDSSVSAWKGAACTTSLASTIDANKNVHLLATTNGTDCSELALFIPLAPRGEYCSSG